MQGNPAPYMIMLGPLSPHLRKNPVRRRGLTEERISFGISFGLRRNPQHVLWRASGHIICRISQSEA